MSEPTRGVTVWVDDEPVRCDAERPLLQELQRAGRVVATSCGGIGVCHLCRVTIENAPPASELQRRALGNVLIAQGMRLSCQVTVSEGLRVHLPKIETPEERRERIRRARARRPPGAGRPP